MYLTTLFNDSEESAYFTLLVRTPSVLFLLTDWCSATPVVPSYTYTWSFLRRTINTFTSEEACQVAGFRKETTNRSKTESPHGEFRVMFVIRLFADAKIISGSRRLHPNKHQYTELCTVHVVYIETWFSFKDKEKYLHRGKHPMFWEINALVEVVLGRLL